MKSSSITGHKPSDPPVLRHELGEVLRDLRQGRSMTLRDVSARARVSLGYLSEIKRDQKEASLGLLAAVCYVLGAPVSFVLCEVTDHIALQGRVPVGEVSQTPPVGLLYSLISAIQFAAFSRGVARDFQRTS